MGRFELDGGAAVRLAFGLTAWRQVPDSYADAADVTSEDLIATASRFIHAAVDGCTEFCRLHERDSLLDFLPFSEGGPLMEQGCETSDGMGWSRTGPGLCDLFEQQWQPWPRSLAS